AGDGIRDRNVTGVQTCALPILSKIIRTEKPSVLPFYGAAAVFLVLCALLPVYKLWALVLTLVATAVSFGAAKRFCPPRVVEREEIGRASGRERGGICGVVVEVK